MRDEIESIKVTAIISTYNRYKSLQIALKSIMDQTHKNIEVIVINDKSTDKEYYENKRPEGIKWIDLEKSSRDVLGFPSAGYTLNVGLSHATGKYVAILDDDDAWMKDKISTQLLEMEKGQWFMSCTEGYMGSSLYNANKKYPLYYQEYYAKFCKKFFLKHYGTHYSSLPGIFNLELIQKHNFIIHSSVMINKKLFSIVGGYKNIEIRMKDTKPLSHLDGELWGRILKIYDCLYIKKPLIYFDGRLYEKKISYKFKNKIFKLFTYVKT